jgi:hypothetical protein
MRELPHNAIPNFAAECEQRSRKADPAVRDEDLLKSISLFRSGRVGRRWWPGR